MNKATSKDCGELFGGALYSALPSTAIAAGEALRTLGADWVLTPAFREALRGAVKGRSEPAKRNLARILGAWGHAVVDEPLALLATKGRPGVKREALLMSGTLRGESDDAFPKTREAILKALGDRRPEIRIAACAAAGRRRIGAAAKKLGLLIAKDKAPWVGCYAVRALERLRIDIDLESVRTRLKRNLSDAQRTSCLKAIATLGRPSNLPTLRALLRAREADVRHAALMGLQRSAQPALFGGAQDDWPSLVPGMAPEVAELAEELIRVAMNDPNRRNRSAAARCLGRLGAATAGAVQQAMPKWLVHSDAHVRTIGAELCTVLKPQALYANLLSLALQDPDPAVRRVAARSLEAVDGARAGRDLLAMLAGAKKPPGHGSNAVVALGYVRKMAVLDGLIAALPEATDTESQRRLQEALERLTGHRFGLDPAEWLAWRKLDKTPFAEVPPAGDRAARVAAVIAEKRHGFPPELENSIVRGLGWLERRQHAVGYWAGAEDKLGKHSNRQPAYTALCVLAFAGAGHGPARGCYREAVWRAMEFLSAVQGYDGRPPGSAQGKTPRAGHAIRGLGLLVIPMYVLALIEAHTSDSDSEWRAPAQRAIDYVLNARQIDGAWGRHERDRSWTSSTCLFGLALSAAVASGLAVPDQTFDHVDARIVACTTDFHGEAEALADRGKPFASTVGRSSPRPGFAGERIIPDRARSSIGEFRGVSINELVLAYRFASGWERTHPGMVGWATRLQEDYPKWGSDDSGLITRWTHLRLWFGSWSMFQMGGSHWRRWSRRMVRSLAAHLRRAPPELYGSWDPDTRHTERGRLFATAAGVMALQSWYRLAPILAR